MPYDRTRIVTAAVGLTLGLTTVAAVSLVSAAPTAAEPDIKDVKSRVDRLYHEAEQAQERYNDARLDLAELDADLGSLRADQRRQQDRLDAARESVEDSIVRQYQGEGLSSVGSVVVSDDPSAFLGQLTTMSAFNDLQDQAFADYSTELKALDIRTDATEQRAAEAERTKAAMAEDKESVDDKLAEAKGLLADLEAEEREELLSRGGSGRVPSSVPASGRAAAAVKTAMAQVGEAYVYGAAGPNAYDCSGLTMVAWASAGVGLPHSSGAQYGSGPHVAESNLMPGDLVFYYSPISHVGMYIGNGLIVHAANPGTGVAVSALHSMPYVGAVRPG